MKWFALFWAYRREFFVGWMRGWRRSRIQAFTAAAGAPMLTRDEARARLNLPPLESPPGWIERPFDWPEWSEKNIRRFYED